MGESKVRAIVFPGQGSQGVGMGKDFAEQHDQIAALYHQASEVLGYDLAAVCFEGPQETLNLSHHAQLGIFVTSVAAYRALELAGKLPSVDFFAGHSLGEWTALHLAGVVDFEEAVRILQARGSFMQAACEDAKGAMLAVMNLSRETLDNIASEVGCYVANYNSLTQTVLSGGEQSIIMAEEKVLSAGAKRAVRLPVAGAFHSPLMQRAADQMEAFLADIDFKPPHTPVYANVTGLLHEPAQISEKMVSQITSSVQWVACVQSLVAVGVEEAVECGPGKVLAGLIKRIDKQLAVRNIGQISDVQD
jgi:[acyl-carrier-protein] S-malonyltransferase